MNDSILSYLFTRNDAARGPATSNAVSAKDGARQAGKALIADIRAAAISRGIAAARKTEIGRAAETEAKTQAIMDFLKSPTGMVMIAAVVIVVLISLFRSR